MALRTPWGWVAVSYKRGTTVRRGGPTPDFILRPPETFAPQFFKNLFIHSFVSPLFSFIYRFHLNLNLVTICFTPLLIDLFHPRIQT